MAEILKKEDYEEPRCALCMEPRPGELVIKSVPQQRILEKMDEYMSRRDYAGAQRHLLYWLEEAKLGNDQRGELLIHNELIGHYRKTNQKEEAFSHIQSALTLLNTLEYDGTITAGTTLINAATACQAFGESERAMDLFRKAKEIYESRPETQPQLLGGLYNNMGLTCTALGQYDQAYHYFALAMEIMKQVPGGELEQAMTLLNKADTIEAEKGMEEGEKEIEQCLDDALELLGSPNIPINGYRAFVYEKCASVFDYYGYFAAAKKLQKEAEAWYAAHP